MILSNSLAAAILVDLPLMDSQNFRDGELPAPCQLFRQLPIEIPELFIGAAVRFQHFRPHQVLGTDNVVNVVVDGLLQQILPWRCALQACQERWSNKSESSESEARS